VERIAGTSLEKEQRMKHFGRLNGRGNKRSIGLSSRLRSDNRFVIGPADWSTCDEYGVYWQNNWPHQRAVDLPPGGWITFVVDLFGASVDVALRLAEEPLVTGRSFVSGFGLLSDDSVLSDIPAGK
jgi:hypothetical protein